MMEIERPKIETASLSQACPRTAATADSSRSLWNVALASHWATACVVCFFPLCPVSP